jgi:hypothetical protein
MSYLAIRKEGDEITNVVGPFETEYKADRYASLLNNYREVDEDRWTVHPLEEPEEDLL